MTTLPLDRQTLIDRHVQGERFKYLFFWGHTPGRDGTVDKSCFSQWSDAPFTVDSRLYPTAEHWMMAGKARLFEDHEALEEVLLAQSPGAAKAVGRKIRNFDRAIWNRHNVGIVVQGNEHKFGQNSALKDYLLATSGRVLVEAAPRDRIWGIGLGAANPKSNDPSAWRGQNLLGFALMAARDRLTEAVRNV